MTGTRSKVRPHGISVRGPWLEPFALRALGQVREDDELIRQALEQFETMGLDWHVAQTRKRLTDGA